MDDKELEKKGNRRGFLVVVKFWDMETLRRSRSSRHVTKGVGALKQKNLAVVRMLEDPQILKGFQCLTERGPF